MDGGLDKAMLRAAAPPRCRSLLPETLPAPPHYRSTLLPAMLPALSPRGRLLPQLHLQAVHGPRFEASRVLEHHRWRG